MNPLIFQIPSLVLSPFNELGVLAQRHDAHIHHRAMLAMQIKSVP